MDQGATETLPKEPTEEEFCLSLRNGLILCNVLNLVNPGAVPKVVENPVITVQSIDGAAQSAIQYFENMRNFLVAVRSMKLLTFEASDLEKGGSSAKVVDCILCLQGYHEWKLAGGIGVWRYGGTVKITNMSRGLPSSLLSGSSDKSLDDYNLQNNQQLSEFLHSTTEATLEDSRATDALDIIFNQFGAQLLKAVFSESSDAEEFPVKEKVGKFIDLVLEQAVKEFYIHLISHKNKLGLLLRKEMKSESRTMTKAHLIEVVSKFLIENVGNSSLSTKLYLQSGKASKDKEDKLDDQQKYIEKLKISFSKMKDEVECQHKKWKEDLENLECNIQGLKVNTSSYLKLLEENRMLYNQVQDLKGNIRVYCRVRPFLQHSDRRSVVEHIGENGNVIIMDPSKQGKDARKIFSFNRAFGANATQSDIYADTQPLIRSVLDGYNVCIFAYGQTGSGKTYTMSGPDIKSESTSGVNYRALDDLFHISQSRQGIISYQLSVQMIEIYNEQVRDLLVADGSDRRLDIRNYSQLNGLNIPDASLVAVKCTQDVLELMKVGQRNRAVGTTALNDRSSRSHSVLTIHIQGKESASGAKLRGCLHLVDLAGSERVDKSEATGDRLKEAQYINRSLSALGDVISALAQKSSHVPYRNSKLTQVLQDALGGQAKTLMFVHVNPEANAFGETISTLKFAERVASIELGVAQVNKEAGQVIELKEEISRLRTALESKETELKQLKIQTRHMGFEVQKTETRSPLELSVKRRPEYCQQSNHEFKKLEPRSCSSVKQQNPLCSSVISSSKKVGARPLFISGESCESTNVRSESPQIRRSISADRAPLMRRKAKAETASERTPLLKLQFMEKTPASKFNSAISTELTNESLSRCWDPHEISNLRNDNPKQADKQFKPGVQFRHGKIQRITTENKPGMKQEESIKLHMFDADTTTTMLSQKNCQPSETENVGTLLESPNDCNYKLKKFHHNPRISPNVKLRASIQAEELLPSGKKANKQPPPAFAAQNVKERLAPELSSSKHFPCGKFTL
ncbi:kinesin-like protein KIN-14F [Curcuma longa]|uniref:kinesin-like protein KIN-14F n=1 Tax=Curcuma longa TaxID=136217 RepID=UPI003D9E40A3